MPIGRAISRTLPVCAAIAALPLLASGGCFTASDGLDPPTDSLYFPTNLVTSPGGKTLYAVNSDFDLQYNGGTVQALDLEALRAKTLQLANALQDASKPDPEAPADPTKEACAKIGLAKNQDADVTLYPGPCGPLALGPFIKNWRSIGAFASGAALVSNPDKPEARLFVSVRGDPSVTYFDVSDDRSQAGLDAAVSGCNKADGAFCLACQESSDTRRCGSDHIVGVDESENARHLTLPVEPIGIAGSPSGEALVTAHQTEQAASVVVNRWGGQPTLEYYLTGLAYGPTEVAALPEPGVARVSGGSIAWQPGFLVTFRAAAELDLIRYNDDHEANPARPFISRAGVTGITVNSRGNDSRGIAIDASDRQACEASCDTVGGDDAALLACMRACLPIPLRVFVANRAPASLLIGEITTKLEEQGGQPIAAFEDISIHDTVPLAFGASRVAVGRIIDQDGKLQVRAFVLAFDSRLVFVYDPVARRVETVIRTGRGPHAVSFDTGGEGDSLHSFLYIGHFTDSYIGVVDLDMRRPNTYGSMIVTVGKPVPPRGSQ